MSGSVEAGRCPVCGNEDVNLNRKYYHYDIKCECHGPEHFDKVKAKLELEKWNIEISSLYNNTLTREETNNNINRVNAILLQLKKLEKKRILNKKLNKINDNE